MRQSTSVSATYINLAIHVVFATRGRMPKIADAWRQDLHAYIAGTLSGLGAEAVIVGGTMDMCTSWPESAPISRYPTWFAK